MKERHKKASGGPTDMDGEKESKGSTKARSYSAPNNVEKEADDENEGGEMKKGGRVKKRADGGKVEGKKPAMRLDRPKRRKDGGRVGSDMSPMSSAAKSFKEPAGHKTDNL